MSLHEALRVRFLTELLCASRVFLRSASQALLGPEFSVSGENRGGAERRGSAGGFGLRAGHAFFLRDFHQRRVLFPSLKDFNFLLARQFLNLKPLLEGS